MRCPNCGREQSDNSVFCVCCGAQMSVPPVQQTVPPMGNPVPPMGNPVPPMGNPVPPMGNPVPPTTPKSNNKAVLAVVLIALTGLAIYFLMSFGGLFGGSGNDKASSAGESGSQQAEGPLAGNPYADCLREYEAYVLPESAQRYLSCEDVDNLSEEALRVAAAEIAARHGAVAEDAQLQAYFEARDWYTSTGGSWERNAYERANQMLLEVQLGKKDGSLYDQQNPYLNQFPEGQGYAVSGSDGRYMTASDLKNMNKEQLTIARNEIYARKGCIFETENLQKYFYTKSWYKPSLPVSEFQSSEMNKYEKNNIKFVQIYEMRAEGVAFSAGNPYIGVYETYRNQQYIFADSSRWALTESDLLGLTVEELSIARNEIYARNGYTFSSENLLEYFLLTDWYYPDTPCGDSDAVSFTATEKENIALLKERETYVEKYGAGSGSGSSSGSSSGSVTQQSKYVYTANGCCYHIPVVEKSGVDAETMNSKLYNIYYDILREDVLSLSADQRFLLGMVYTVGQKGDVVSVTVRCINDCDLDYYGVYYFSASTGKELKAEDLLQAYGLSKAEGHAQIKNALERYWETQGGWIDQSAVQEQKERTLADSNIQKVSPVISGNGSLMFVGTIYSLAGADSYEYCFDKNGKIQYISCKEH